MKRVVLAVALLIATGIAGQSAPVQGASVIGHRACSTKYARTHHPRRCVRYNVEPRAFYR